MYHQKRLSLAVLLLVGLSHIFAIQLPCASDDDCSNGQGVCTLIGSSNYCSCLSGFGGEDCSIRPDSSCSFDAVDALESTLQTTSSLVYLYPNLTLSVSANLEESKFAFPDLNETLNVVPYSEELTIIFGNGSYAECDFPTNNSDWRDLAATAGNCEDNYSLSLAFTDAVSKCGFADDNGNRVYEQTISINRKYKLESLRGQALTRVDTSYKTLRVIFPLEVSVSTSNVQVVGSPSLLAAITDIDYLPGSSKWAVETTTSIQSPFKLVNPAVIASTGSIQSDNRVSTASISVVSGCSTNQQDCFQKVSLDFVAGNALDACLGLTGSVTVELDVVCSEGAGANCPLLGGETVQLVINLATSDACPVTEEITFSTTTLSSFSDAAALNARHSFITNQVAYFGADIQSTDAQISARNVKSGSVCFQIGAAACQPVAYQVEASDNGKDPIFSVDFSAVANAGVFGNLNLASATSENYQVKAVIEVDFSGVSKKAGIHKSQQATGIKEVQLTTSVKLTKADHSGAASAVPSMILLVGLFLFGMLL